MTDQRKRIYCVGLPKAGTHSVAGMLSPVLRTAHEPEPELLIPLMSDARMGALDADDARRFLLARDQRLNLEFESSHLLGAVTPNLVDAFPGARFVLVVRECRSWIDSMINDQLNLRPWQHYRDWVAVYEYYLRCKDQEFGPVEGVLEDLDLYPLRNYARSWCSQILRITRTVPTERLLTIRTHELASSGKELAAFVGGRSADVDLGRSHAYKTPRSHHVLDRIPDDYVREVIATEVDAHGAGLLQRLA